MQRSPRFYRFRESGPAGTDQGLLGLHHIGRSALAYPVRLARRKREVFPAATAADTGQRRCALSPAPEGRVVNVLSIS